MNDLDKFRHKLEKEGQFIVNDNSLYNINSNPIKFQENKNFEECFKEKIHTNPPKIFISGHSHILKVQYDKKLNLLHLNPGAAGNHGFHKIKTMLRFQLENGEIKNLEIIELGQRG
jgi:predicted phosphodiesterase